MSPELIELWALTWSGQRVSNPRLMIDFIEVKGLNATSLVTEGVSVA